MIEEKETDQEMLRRILERNEIIVPEDEVEIDKRPMSTTRIYAETAAIVARVKKKLRDELEIKISNAEILAMAVNMTFQNGRIPESIIRKAGFLRDLKRKNPTKREFSDIMFVCEALRQKLVRDMHPMVLSEWILDLTNEDIPDLKFQKRTIKDKIQTLQLTLGENEISVLLDTIARLLQENKIDKTEYDQSLNNAMKYLQYLDILNEIQHAVDEGVQIQRLKEGRDPIPGPIEGDD